MPLPELFPWSQVGLYRPDANITSAEDFYSFLEADVVFAAEIGSGESPEAEQDPSDSSLKWIQTLLQWNEEAASELSGVDLDEIFSQAGLERNGGEV